MPLKESEAIVLRTYPLGEGDRLVSFLDRQAGRVRGVARGARLTKNRFGSTLEMLAYIRIWYFERETRELVRINQCELIESFMDVQQDYFSATGLALVSEITGFGAGREGSGGGAISAYPSDRASDSSPRTISSNTCIFLFVDRPPRRMARGTRPLFALWKSDEPRNYFSFSWLRGTLLPPIAGTSG